MNGLKHIRSELRLKAHELQGIEELLVHSASKGDMLLAKGNARG